MTYNLLPAFRAQAAPADPSAHSESSAAIDGTVDSDRRNVQKEIEALRQELDDVKVFAESETVRKMNCMTRDQASIHMLCTRACNRALPLSFSPLPCAHARSNCIGDKQGIPERAGRRHQNSQGALLLPFSTIATFLLLSFSLLSSPPFFILLLSPPPCAPSPPFASLCV